LVSVADFERMSRAEREKYLNALIGHLEALRQVPIGDALTLAAPGNASQPKRAPGPEKADG